MTGAAGQVGYARSTASRPASCSDPIPDRRSLMDIAAGAAALRGVAMELDDCAFPLLSDRPDVQLRRGFRRCVVGAAGGRDPAQAGHGAWRSASRGRSELHRTGAGIGAHAATDVRVLVVGNPWQHQLFDRPRQCADVPDDRWFAMTRLDENRAKAQLAQKAGVPVARVSNLAIGEITQPRSILTLSTRGSMGSLRLKSLATTPGSGATSSPPSRGAARRSSRRAVLLRRVGRQRDHRLGPRDPRGTAPGDFTSPRWSVTASTACRRSWCLAIRWSRRARAGEWPRGSSTTPRRKRASRPAPRS